MVFVDLNPGRRFALPWAIIFRASSPFQSAFISVNQRFAPSLARVRRASSLCSLRSLAAKKIRVHPCLSVAGIRCVLCVARRRVNRFLPPLQGLPAFVDANPGRRFALPWAIIFRTSSPFQSAFVGVIQRFPPFSPLNHPSGYAISTSGNRGIIDAISVLRLRQTAPRGRQMRCKC